MGKVRKEKIIHFFHEPKALGVYRNMRHKSIKLSAKRKKKDPVNYKLNLYEIVKDKR